MTPEQKGLGNATRAVNSFVYLHVKEVVVDLVQEISPQ